MVAKSRPNAEQLPPREEILRAAYAEEARYAEERLDDIQSRKKSRKLSYIALGVALVALEAAWIIHLLLR